MNASNARLRLRDTLCITLFVIAAALLLAFSARFALDRRSAARRNAELQRARDRLQAIADDLEQLRVQSENHKRTVWNVLGLARAAVDLPDLEGDRIVARHQGFEKLCMYVPEGSHRLEISTSWKATDMAEQAGRTDKADPPSVGQGSWSIPLIGGSGYFFRLTADRNGGPIQWELTSKHPDFEARTETVPLDGFSQRGSGWSGTEVFAFPNQVPRGSVRHLESEASAPAAVELLEATLRGVRHDRPYEIAVNVRLRSDAPACISASEALPVIILKKQHLLHPYRGEGKYELRAN